MVPTLVKLHRACRHSVTAGAGEAGVDIMLEQQHGASPGKAACEEHASDHSSPFQSHSPHHAGAHCEILVYFNMLLASILVVLPFLMLQQVHHASPSGKAACDLIASIPSSSRQH